MNFSLFETLDRLGLAYSVRRLDDGTPYAGLQWASSPSHVTIGMTLIVIEGVLRITAHDAPALTGGWVEEFAMTERLPLGRVVASADGLGSEVIVGIVTAELADSDTLVSELFAYMEAVFDSVGRHPVAALHRPLVTIPTGTDLVGGPMERAAQDIGWSPGADGWETATSNGRVRCTLDVDDGWLVASGSHEGQGGLSLASVSDVARRLQRWSAAGRFLIGDDGGVSALVESPLGNDGRLTVQWTLEQVKVMLATATRHLRPDAP